MSETERAITDPSAFQERSLAIQVVLGIVTLSLYFIYWWHLMHKQVAEGTNAEFDPTIRTLAMFVPIYNFVIMWRDSHDLEPVTEKDGVLIFLLFIVFAPAAWYLVQTSFNRIAQEQ